VPYAPIIIYDILSSAVSIQNIIGLETDLVIRKCVALLVYSNCVINPIIYFRRSSSFRQMVMDTVRNF
jgi:hypothetical protein